MGRMIDSNMSDLEAIALARLIGNLPDLVLQLRTTRNKVCTIKCAAQRGIQSLDKIDADTMFYHIVDLCDKTVREANNTLAELGLMCENSPNQG